MARQMSCIGCRPVSNRKSTCPAVIVGTLFKNSRVRHACNAVERRARFKAEDGGYDPDCWNQHTEIAVRRPQVCFREVRLDDVEPTWLDVILRNFGTRDTVARPPRLGQT
jgi:hypothetical protein